jgi:hypothetical protein
LKQPPWKQAIDFGRLFQVFYLFYLFLPEALANIASIAVERSTSTACPEPVVDAKHLAAVCRIKRLGRLRCCALPVLCCGRVGAPAGQTVPVDLRIR